MFPDFVPLEKLDQGKKNYKILGCMKGYNGIPNKDQMDKWEVWCHEAVITYIAKYYKKHKDQSIIDYDKGECWEWCWALLNVLKE